MFGFFEEIIQKAQLPFEYLSNGYKVINFSNKLVYVEGYSSLMNVSTKEVILKLKKGVLKLVGSDLSIKNMNRETLLVVGKILSCEVC